MRCSNPDCSRGIGLVAYRRSWLSNRRYCSMHCRDAFVAALPKQSQRQRCAESYFEWLFHATESIMNNGRKVLSKTTIALSAALVLSATLPGSATSKHRRIAHVHSTIYNTVPDRTTG